MDGLDTELARVAAVLVDDRVLRRVIKKHRRLPGIGLQVPHARCYPLPRAELLPLVERGELHVEPEALPDHVALVTGSRTALAAGDPAELRRAWRAIFHARVHQAFDDRLASGATSPSSVRERIHRIGQTEFDEIRSVLRQEDLLLPPSDDTTTYIEFVATYLELQQFAPRTLDRTFPTLDLPRVDAAIALDLDLAMLLAASRPAGAPELNGRPAVRATTELPVVAAPAERAPISDGSARAKSSRARVKGNRARAAILALRAGDRDQARVDLDELGERLARALGSPGPGPGGPGGPGWTDALLPVAELAATQRVLRFTAAARLLHDLQTACVVSERETKVVDAVGWALSLGNQPLVRALPATREVRVAKHLHAAAQKLAGCGPLSAAEHERLAAAVRDMVGRANAQVRVVLRPKIAAALDGVALHPHNLPERVAEKKLVDELLDQVVAVGRLSLGNLRDAISHNDLKMPDLQPRELSSGDELLRCDRALSRSLDGVYRRGEAYLRFLQKASSVLFGTPVGRFLSLYIILPLLGSFTVLKGAEEMIGLVAKHTGHAARELAALDAVSPDAAAALHTVSQIAREVHHGPELATRTAVLGGAVFLFFVLHVTGFRRAVVFVLRQLGRALRLLLFDLPRALLGRPLVLEFWSSRFARWVLKPGIPAAMVFLATDGLVRWPLAAGAFGLFALVLNSRIGRTFQELAADGVVRSGRHLTSHIVPAVIRWILDLFVELMELIDRGLYRVDEWLRFKGGEARVTLVIKGVLGTIWSAFAYFLRLYVNLFIEPVVNPIKHFPVVTVAAKLMVPFYAGLMSAISGPANQLMGPALGTSFAAFTVFVIPGLAGFLVWELKENWKLYGKTRPKTLREVSIGHHGESMVGFLKPGFHSGTIPKRFTKLRRAAWKADEHGVAKHRAELHHVEDAIHKFADRELVSMLNEAAAFRITDVAAGHIAIGSNRVQIELAAPSHGGEPARIAFELQSGWIVASIPTRGWIDALDDDQRRILEIALAGFYKRAGVDLVREQLEQVLAGDASPPPYDISSEGLIVWPGHGYHTEAVYDLRALYPSPRLRGAAWNGELPPLTGHRALYFREPLTWSAWTQVWEQLARHEEPMPIVVGPPLLRRPPPRATALAG
ncbi:MAG TPA: hypothetical protein VH165_11405 [Kofleriaceae bacterium]|nr:hypothetical protein [Kofleriaceae bacterium]